MKVQFYKFWQMYTPMKPSSKSKWWTNLSLTYQKFPHDPWLSQPTPVPRQLLICFISLEMNLGFVCTLFFIWFPSLSIIILTFIHFVAWLCSSLLLLLSSFYCMAIPRFVDGMCIVSIFLILQVKLLWWHCHFHL